ncbi:MAG TPA: ABC transporter substrate-binding protein [Chloroflexota bacterium]|nr:ABC transporter substrate-binding protein [Chloroflexota bacterium]
MLCSRSVGSRSFLRAAFVASLAIILVLVNSAPSLASKPAAKIRIGGTVTIDNVQGSLWSCSFNPYGATTSLLSAGIIYEPLWYVNQDNNKGQPWLAKKYAWSNHNKTLTFTLRSGVKWADGKPLTAADVVFTFKLLKRFPGIDVNAIWTVLSNVVSHKNKIVFSFKQAAVPFFYYIGDQTFIVPQHTWSKVKNPVTYLDAKPTGSGPFKLHKCSPQNIEYIRNPHYWQKGKPYLSKIEYPAFIDNSGGNGYLDGNNKDVWGAQYIPNINASYVHAPNVNSKVRHYWFPPQGYDVIMYPNLKRWPTNILAVRQAISIGLDRAKVSRLGVYGYLPPANQSGIIVPDAKSWYDKSLAKKYNYSYNPGKAKKLLEKAGFKLSNGIFHDKKGRKLSISVLNVGGYSDWVGEVQAAAADLRQIGIELKPENVSGTTHSADEQDGEFQMSYDSPLGGPTPYYQFRQLLDSANTAPIGPGKLAQSNFERFRSKAVDSLLKQYALTNSSKQQHTIIDKIQQVMLKQVPVIPVLEGVNWYEYDTTDLTGWVNKKNDYAAPAAYNFPDQMVVLLHLHLK